MAKFLELQKKNLTSGDASRNFFKLVKNYSSREKPPDFDVRDLYPGKQDVEVAESLADHFNSISSEFNGLDESSTLMGEDDIPLPVLTVTQVAARLRLFKKPRGVMGGDIFPAPVPNTLVNLPSHSQIFTMPSYPQETGHLSGRPSS